MKLRVSSIISSFLLFFLLGLPTVYGCWWPEFSTHELWLYRICPYGATCSQGIGEREANCQLWQQQTSADIPVKDVEKAVYQYTYNTWKYIEDYVNGKRDDFTNDTVGKILDSNAFVKYIVQKNDIEALDFLLLAKRVEETRWAMRDPWYYPYEQDAEHVALREVIRQCEAYQGSRFKSRYALQAMRTLFSLKQFDQCVQFWEKVGSTLPQDALYAQVENYAGGAYFRQGNKEKALDIFTRNGDVPSIQMLGYNYQAAFEVLFEKNPNANYFPEMLQTFIDKYEYHLWYEEAYGDVGKKYVEQATWLNGFAQKALSDPRVNDPLMWAFVASCTYDFLGKSEEGLAILQQNIHHVSPNDFLNNSARVFRIYLQTKTSRYNIAEPDRFLTDMKWIEQQLRAEMAPLLADTTQQSGYYYTPQYFYCNAWRRILLECAIPNALAAGDTTLAIFYANASENLFANILNDDEIHRPKMSPIEVVAPYMAGRLTDEKWYEMYEKEIVIRFNRHDYSNQMFQMVDSLSTAAIIRYWNAVHAPKSPTEKFLNQCGYLDADYWQDIIGTHALRELDYPLAISYLKKVSSEYQYHTNVYLDNGMWRNPFHYNPKYNIEPIDDNRNYKLTFAQDMAGLEQKMNHSSDPNVRARSMILYALGMKNSMNCCWGLAYYSKTSYEWMWIDGEEDEKYKDYFDAYASAEAKYRTQVWNRADSLIQAAFPLFTDPEQAAMEYSKLAMVWKVAELYPDTQTGRWLSQHCDLWEDYVKAAKAKKQ